MTAIEAIMTRRSCHNYTDEPIREEDIHTIVEAGMLAPSCANTRDWFFIVVTDRNVLDAMAERNGTHTRGLKACSMAILICGDLNRSFPRAKDYWVIDCAIAGENMVLAAKSLGIGSGWIGTWPQTERVNALAEYFRLPENIVPHSIICFGYPAEETYRDRPGWEPDRVHYEKW